MRRWQRVLSAALLGTLLVALAGVAVPLRAPGPVFAWYLQQRAAHVVRQMQGSNSSRMAEDGVDIVYPSGMLAQAQLILRTAANDAPKVFEDLQSTRPKTIHIVLAANQATLNRDLHLPAKSRPIGAYWHGVIWVLAPEAWIFPDDAGWSAGSFAAETFRNNGPMAHELAHLALDLRLEGSQPVWFDEGVAQWEDRQVTGFEWQDARNTLNQPLYTYAQMASSFEDLPNTALAYREAYLWVAELAAAHHGQGLADALARMDHGDSLLAAAHAVLGDDYDAWRAGHLFAETAARDDAS